MRMESNGMQKVKRGLVKFTITKIYVYQYTYILYKFRATGSTHAHLEGVSLLDISKNLGHAKIETTKFYIPDIRQSLRSVG